MFPDTLGNLEVVELGGFEFTLYHFVIYTFNTVKKQPLLHWVLHQFPA